MIGQRVKLINEHRHFGIIIPKCCVGTIVAENDNTIIFSYYDEDRPLAIKISKSNIMNVKKEDLNISYQHLIKPEFRIGAKFNIQDNEATIMDIKLSEYVDNDLYTLLINDNKYIVEFNKLNEMISYVPIGMDTEEKEKNIFEYLELINKDKVEQEVNINGYKFIFVDDNIKMPIININDIQKFIDALNQVKIIRGA